MDYQKVLLSGPTAVGLPAPLPADLVGAQLHDSDRADLAWTPIDLGFHGFGYWPAVDVTPAYDARLKAPGAWASVTLDAVGKVANGVRTLNDVPNPAPRTISKIDFRRRFTDEEQGREAIFRQTAAEKTAAELSDPANLIFLKARIAYQAASEVSGYELDDPDTIGFVQLLRAAGVLETDERVAEILA